MEPADRKIRSPIPVTPPTEALTVEELDEMERAAVAEGLHKTIALIAAARAHLEGGQPTNGWKIAYYKLDESGQLLFWGLSHEAVNALPRAHLGGGWRPIDTAPTDGTDVLLWFGAHVGWILCGRYDGRWRDSYCYKKLDRGNSPTHWHPLPSPPAERDEDGTPTVDALGERPVGPGNPGGLLAPKVAPPAPGECICEEIGWPERRGYCPVHTPAPGDGDEGKPEHMQFGRQAAQWKLPAVPSPDNAKLVERLREAWAVDDPRQYDLNILNEAADSLEALRKENGDLGKRLVSISEYGMKARAALRKENKEATAMWFRRCEHLRNEYLDAKAENERLREALKPFAECMTFLSLKQEHFNEARAALKEKGEK